jgi:hypothetical protein
LPNISNAKEALELLQDTSKFEKMLHAAAIDMILQMRYYSSLVLRNWGKLASPNFGDFN